MKRKILITTAMLALVACASEPTKTLDQKLSDATNPAARKEALRDGCLNEAEWPVYNSSSNQTGRIGIENRAKTRRSPEVREMQTLCAQMDQLTSAAPDNKYSAQDLSSSCAKKVEAKKKNTRKGWDEHATRIETICTQMLNLKNTN